MADGGVTVTEFNVTQVLAAMCQIILQDRRSGMIQIYVYANIFKIFYLHGSTIDKTVKKFNNVPEH